VSSQRAPAEGNLCWGRPRGPTRHHCGTLRPYPIAMREIVIDTETTGLDPLNGDRIVRGDAGAARRDAKILVKISMFLRLVRGPREGADRSLRGRIDAERGEALHRREVGEPPCGAAAGEDRDEVDGLGDEGARHRDDGFLDKLIEAAQRADRGAGVSGFLPVRLRALVRREHVRLVTKTDCDYRHRSVDLGTLWDGWRSQAANKSDRQL
jgi:hypothetical protein